MSHRRASSAAAQIQTIRREPTAVGELPDRRGVPATVGNALTAVVGGVTGLLPHVLHHVSLLGGAILVTGATGNALFAALGLVFSLPLLRRLHRRFRTWKAPALALAIFALMFSLSAFLIGPAISEDSPAQVPTPEQTPPSDGHEGHHG